MGAAGLDPDCLEHGARFGLNLISAVNGQGLFWFMGVEGRVNAGVFILFLKRLLVKADRMIFLIVDGHPTHKAAKVRRFVASESKRLRSPLVSSPSSPMRWGLWYSSSFGRVAAATVSAMSRAP